MPKIKTKNIQTGTEPVRIPTSVRAYSPQSINVPKARGQRVFEGEGAVHIKQGADVLSRGLSDIGTALVEHEVKMTETKASSELADLSNVLSSRMLQEVYPLKSGKADAIFSESVALMKEGKEPFLERAGDNISLRNMLSMGYDAVTQKHLKEVLDHKLSQDKAFMEDTAKKVGMSLQSEMSSLIGADISKASVIAKQIDQQLSDYPRVALLMKQAGYQSMFKANARVAPDLTQKIYQTPSVRKQITKDIGSEGYDAIQAQIDLGKTIGLRDGKLTKLRAKEKEDKRIEKIMTDGYTDYAKGKLSHTSIDALDIPSPHKRILDGLLMRQNARIDETAVDHSAYVLLSEQVRNPAQFDLTRDQVYANILNAENKTITEKQGKALIDRFSKVDTFKHPAVVDAYKQLAGMRADGDFEDYIEYYNAVSDLDAEVLKSNGDHTKVGQFMKEILLPRVRVSATRRLLQGLGILKESPDYIDQGTEIGPYLLEGERDRINEYLIDTKVKDLDEKQIDYSRLSNKQKRAMIKYIRSQ